jgi:hypothetical protein
MLTRKPKRAELLPLFVGQPLAMTVLMLVVTLALSVLSGVGHFAWNLFHPGATASFLPTQDVVVAAICFGIALGIFNIAGDSAEMDTVLERRTPSIATYLLVDLSLTFVEGALHTLVKDTYLTQYVGAFELSLLGTLLVAFVELRVLHWHFRNCLQDADALQQRLATQA